MKREAAECRGHFYIERQEVNGKSRLEQQEQDSFRIGAECPAVTARKLFCLYFLALRSIVKISETPLDLLIPDSRLCVELIHQPADKNVCVLLVWG